MERAAENLASLRSFDDLLGNLQALLVPPTVGSLPGYSSVRVAETIALIRTQFQGLRPILAMRGLASVEELDGLVEEIVRANHRSAKPLADLRRVISQVVEFPAPRTDDDSPSLDSQTSSGNPHVVQHGKDDALPEGRGGVVTPTRRFDIALSFPGERRAFVEEVARSLGRTMDPKRVLYDHDYEAEFARPDLDIYLQRLYHDESSLIAVFLCADYERKEWCGLEWRAVRDLVKKRQASAVMPLRFDMTEIPGLFSLDGYVWIGERTPEEVSALILERLQIIRSDAAVRLDDDPQHDRRISRQKREPGQLAVRRSLSDTGHLLLTSLLSQKSLDVQKRHGEREASARRKTAGNLNGYALPAAMLDAHTETMREFGQSVLAAHQEAFEADRHVPDERDVQEITDQIARTLEYRRQAVTSEFGRLQMRIGRELPPSLPSALASRQEQMLSELRREVEVWRLKRQLASRSGSPGAPLGAPHVTVDVNGSDNQITVAGRDQTGTTLTAEPQVATGQALTEDEKELLRAAARRGEFLVVPTDQFGAMLLVERRSFFDQADPAVAARYLEALERLKRRGLVRFDEGHLYVLTGSGFETARAL